MKTKSIMFLNVFIFMFLVLSCQKPEINIPQDETDSIEPPVGVLPEMLTLYSWRECKFVMRSDDSSLLDMSPMYLLTRCDTNIFTFNTDGKYYKRNLCESYFYQNWWNFSNNYSRLAYQYAENSSENNEYYIIEKLSEDTLKLFLISEQNPDELFSGALIYYYSVPKEQYK